MSRARSFIAAHIIALVCVLAGAWPTAPERIAYGQSWGDDLEALPTSSPVIVSMTGVSTTGGTSVITGSSFSYSQVKICLHPCTSDAWDSNSVSVTSWTATAINVRVGAKAVGDYDVFVDNFGGGRDISFSALHVISTTSPSTTFGTDLAAQWICDNAVTDVNGVNKVPDSTANALDLTQGTSSAEPQLNVASTKFNGHNSCQHDGVNDFLTKASFALGAGADIYVYGAIYVTASNGSHAQTIANYTGGDVAVRVPVSQTYLQVSKAGTNTDFTAATVVATGSNFLAGFVGASTESISVNNITATSTAITGNASNNAAFNVGERNSLDFAGFEWAEIGVLKRKPTTSEATAVVQYLNGQYQTVAAPSITSVTNAGAGWTSAFRVQGTGFASGLSGQVTIAGTPTTLTATQISSTYAEFSDFPSTSAGTANTFLLSNPDTRSVSYDTLPIVARATDPMSSEGLTVAAWFAGSAVKAGGGTPATSDKIQTWSDLSLSGNDAAQATSANQPTWTVSDANYGGSPSVTGDGSTSRMQVAALRQSTVSEFWVMSVCRQASTTGTQCPYRGSNDVYESTSTGTPRGAKGGTIINWTGTVSGTHQMFARYNGSSTIGINVDNGTEQTLAASGALTNNGAFDVLNRNSANYWNGSCSAIVVYTSPPDLTRARTYGQTVGAP